MRLVSEFTLEENEVADGDTLRIRIKDGAGRPLELITVFIAGAVANGVLGNAAYDLLKSVSGQLKERFKSEVSSKLSTQDAAKIAVGCYCARFRIEDPSIVIVIGARVDIHNIGNIILHTDNGTVFVTIVPAQDGDPDALEIELELPWIPFGIMIFYLPLRRLHVTSGFTPALLRQL